ncbi:hypothetical protein RHMOL_Rhmol07G0061000 [Rhododendron molle]|uniref:Uncharacterized protein n=1 Tax=Rhododendron molle TaxID=49168 RepID=A0ACC0MXV7_RHOML|nr:hypothetical protein RHMOL_Rhmol07G0061000 [Rhododendron molle]
MAICKANLQYLCLLLISISPNLVNARTDNRVALGSSLLASDNSSSWKSPSGDFAFGFRLLDNQNLFLLAIWFDKIPDKNIVWYANGDNPAPKGSKLELTNDGQFTLNNPQGQVIWKADSVGNGVAYASMLDTGNFILANGESLYLWESFKHPSDTILPTQVLEAGAKLYSRQTDNNYSKGRFQLRFLPTGDLVLNTIALPTDFAYGNYYHSDTSDGLNGMNSGYKVVFNESGYIYVIRRNGNEVNLTLGNIASTGDFYHRATLDFDGIFTQYAHPKGPRNGTWVQSWFSVWYEPKDICSDMTGDEGEGACGYNSICILDSFGRPTCECLPGFSLEDPNNKLSGCKQDKVRKCEPGGSNPEELFEIHALSNTFWPFSSNYERFPLSSEDECSRSCFTDCNCVVATIRDGTCWKKKLPLSKGRLERNTYGKALVKVPKSDDSSKFPLSPNKDEGKKARTPILVVSILLGGSMIINLIFVAAISVIMFCSYQKKQKPTRESSILETNIRSFTYKDLRDATDDFREELGRGAFGTVYKGVISSSSSRKEVAVKKLDRLILEGEKEFTTEAIAIAKTHHKNLVRLLGFCDEGPHRLLVYEYMSNGTLASFVFGISKPDWNNRIQMAVGIARGLMYLHEECSTQIIHCDIKPQNILLDDSFTTRISDFGLAKLLMGDETRTQTAIRGTKGYVAPEWFRSKHITAKVDVYSYGVMLLEIICCRKNVELERENEEDIILTDVVYNYYKHKRLAILVENDEEARNDMKRVERIVMVAIWCIQEDPSLRPTMKTVLQMLEGVVEISVPPSPYPFSSIC